MIDTHCHLLPRLDDGPETGDDALLLASDLVGQGVEHVLCTPHFSTMFPTAHADAVTQLHGLRRLLERAGLPLETSLAAEIGPEMALSARIDEIRERAVDGRFAIVEVVADTPRQTLTAIAERLAAAGLRTVFAHPERCRAIQRRVSIVDQLREEGAMVQVVAPSLVGRWGPGAQAAAWRLVDTGRADLLGSDAHGARRRRPYLREAADLIRSRLGLPVAQALTVVNARLMLETVRTE